MKHILVMLVIATSLVACTSVEETSIEEVNVDITSAVEDTIAFDEEEIELSSEVE